MERSYLSWDVGIQNLAYCLITKSEISKSESESARCENNNFEIKKWGIFSLGTPKIICTEKNKKDKQCTQKAIYIQNENYYCKKHGEIIGKKENNINQEKAIINKLEKEDNINYICICNKKASYYINNDKKVMYCLPDAKKQKKILDNTGKNLMKKISKLNSNKIPIETLLTKLFDTLDMNKDFLSVNEVLIENQPSLMNPTMKTMSTALYSYFAMKGLTINRDPNCKIESVKFISPSNKIKVNTDAVDQLDKMKKEKNDINKKDKSMYSFTKNMGVKFCTELIKNDDRNTKLINSVKKKDDMCDAFLQAYQYMFPNGVDKEVSEILDKLVEAETIKINAKNKKKIALEKELKKEGIDFLDL